MREELLHPILSHFSIAFLGISPFIYILAKFSKAGELKDKLTFLYQIMIYMGVVFYIPVIFLGDMAADIIKSKICNFQLLNDHEDLGYWSMGWFIVVIVLDLFNKNKKWINWTVGILLIIGTIELVRVGHMGAKLVYEEGAAVLVARPPCLSK